MKDALHTGAGHPEEVSMIVVGGYTVPVPAAAGQLLIHRIRRFDQLGIMTNSSHPLVQLPLCDDRRYIGNRDQMGFGVPDRIFDALYVQGCFYTVFAHATYAVYLKLSSDGAVVIITCLRSQGEAHEQQYDT